MQSTASILTDAYAGPVSAPSVCEAPFFAEDSDFESVSNAKSGGWVTGLFMSLGLGTAAALGLYCFWQVWQIVGHSS